jgi:hypothetical protein
VAREAPAQAGEQQVMERKKKAPGVGERDGYVWAWRVEGVGEPVAAYFGEDGWETVYPSRREARDAWDGDDVEWEADAVLVRIRRDERGQQ